MIRALSTLCVLAAVLCACDRNEEIRPADEPVVEAPRPAPELSQREPATNPSPSAIDQNGTPTEAARVQNTPGQPAAQNAPAQPSPADPRAENKATGDTTLLRAQADLDTVGKSKLDARATFEDKGDGVQVSVLVEDAAPGTHEVRIYERGDCKDLDDAKALGKPFAGELAQPTRGLPPAPGDLGTVIIGANGKGTLELKATNASLKPNGSDSLLGKTIVVEGLPSERATTAGKDIQPVACGVIRAD